MDGKTWSILGDSSQGDLSLNTAQLDLGVSSSFKLVDESIKMNKFTIFCLNTVWNSVSNTILDLNVQ